MTPSKPLTPTELPPLSDEDMALIRADAEESPHEYHWSNATILRLLATLDATQAVEPGLREAAEAFLAAWDLGPPLPRNDLQRTVASLRVALAARSSSAPAELEALRELSDAASEGPWHPYYTVHGDPYVVTDRVAPWSSIVATVSTEPQDYGKANAAFIVAAVNYVRSRLTPSPENPA